MDNQPQTPNNNYRVTKQQDKKNKRKRVVYISCLVVFICIFAVCAFQIIRYYSDTWQVRRNQKELENILNNFPTFAPPSFYTPTPDNPTDNPDYTPGTVTPSPTEPPIYEPYEQILKINSDFVGWIQLKNADVDFPILQAADNENMIKYIVKDVFRAHGLDVTFMAKPMTGIAGSGEHTHLGVAAKLKDGRKINLFSGKDNEFMGPIGFGALLGILKNYEVINPFVSASNDSLNRLKPGYEAPVCTVTSLGHTVEKPSRNRTVLIGLVRELGNPLATRFELRAPNPKSNTYLVIAASYMAMLDGIKASLAAKKSSDDLLASLSKKWGDEDFYLEKDREYRSEREVFEEFTEEERNKLFGRAPATVWENINAFDIYPEKLEVFKADGVMNDLTLESYKEAIISQWATELHDRIIPNSMETVRRCVKLHDDDDCTNLDISRWLQIDIKRKAIGKDSIGNKCLLTRIKEALDIGDYETASDLQIEMQKAVEDLAELYITYRKNLF